MAFRKHRLRTSVHSCFVVFPLQERIPVLEVVHDLIVEEDESALLSSTHLQAHYLHVRAQDIMYIISKHPKFGMLLRNGNKIDSDTFSQEEINQGQISYHRYPGSGTDPDHFLFKVTYSNHSTYHLHAGMMTNITRQVLSLLYMYRFSNDYIDI